MALSVKQITDNEVKSLIKKSAKGDKLSTITTKNGFEANTKNTSYLKLMFSSHMTCQDFRQKPPNDSYRQIKNCQVVSGFKLAITKVLEGHKNGSFKGLTKTEVKTLTNMLEIK